MIRYDKYELTLKNTIWEVFFKNSEKQKNQKK